MITVTRYIFFFLMIVIMVKTDANESWAQKILVSLSLEQKIAQLMMVTVVAELENGQFLSKSYPVDPEYVGMLIEKYQIGGIIFLGHGTAAAQVRCTQQLQSKSAIPLLIGEDFEWGLSMRLTDQQGFARAGMLGKTNNFDLIYQVGREIGRQCSILGVHINFAPVADINTNPDNPVIGTRSFGASKELVSAAAQAYADGLRDAGIIACAKHFPGHGDTTKDSHYTLPLVSHSYERLDDIELYPFKQLIVADIPMIMMAHLEIPALESNPHVPSSLSRTIVTDLLRIKLEFKGIIITDALDMAGITLMEPEPGVAELKALLAGNDILLCPVNVLAAIERITAAVKSGVISEQEIDEHVMRILQLKESILARDGFKIPHVEQLSELETAHTQQLRAEIQRLSEVH